jgi:hypothetical protein
MREGAKVKKTKATMIATARRTRCSGFI